MVAFCLPSAGRRMEFLQLIFTQLETVLFVWTYKSWCIFPGMCAMQILYHWGPTFLDQSHLLVEKFAIFVLYLEIRGAKKIKLF